MCLDSHHLKSVVTFEVKPWDDETDMVMLEQKVREIEMDGLVWGASKLVPIGYGIRKLQITLVVGACFLTIPLVQDNCLIPFIEDEKVSMDELQEKVAELDDYVQSSDIAAMQSMYSFSISVMSIYTCSRTMSVWEPIEWCITFQNC